MRDDGSYVPLAPFARRLTGIKKCFLANSSSRRDLPIPDDWTIEQYGPYGNSLFFCSKMCCLRAHSVRSPINGASQDFVMAKKYGMSDFTAKYERVRLPSS